MGFILDRRCGKGDTEIVGRIYITRKMKIKNHFIYNTQVVDRIIDMLFSYIYNFINLVSFVKMPSNSGAHIVEWHVHLTYYRLFYLRKGYSNEMDRDDVYTHGPQS